ncbi:MAG: hypothetical protein GF350_09160 [Chitinivibrionales bacterium]|nr:hypothetical protein [Chitinivibrionales bacterium]
MNKNSLGFMLLLAAGLSAQGILPVKDSCLVEGTVTDDPSVIGLKRKSMPVPGAIVYLKVMLDVVYPMDGTVTEGTEQLYPVPYPYPYYAIVDSAKTDDKGMFSFGKRIPQSYRITVLAEEYHSKDHDFYLQQDVDLSIVLVPEGAYGAISGNVMTAECPENPDSLALCIIKPVEGCTVTVVQNTIYPYPQPISLGKSSGSEQLLLDTYYAITDADGNYKIDSIPITEPEQTVQVTAHTEGYLPQTKSTRLSNTVAAIVNFSLTNSYANSTTNIVRNVYFTVATDKAVYVPGDQVNIMYKVKNNSRRTITYEMGGCLFGMLVENEKGEAVHEYPGNRLCPMYFFIDTLHPGDSLLYEFPAFNAPGQSGTYTVTAWVPGYEGTSVSVDFAVVAALPVGTETVSGGGTSLEELSFGSRNGALRFTLDKAQNVSVDAFLLNGRSIPVFSNRYMNAGKHEIVPGHRVPTGNTVVFRILGKDFVRIIKAIMVQ